MSLKGDGGILRSDAEDAGLRSESRAVLLSRFEPDLARGRARRSRRLLASYGTYELSSKPGTRERARAVILSRVHGVLLDGECAGAHDASRSGRETANARSFATRSCDGSCRAMRHDVRAFLQNDRVLLTYPNGCCLFRPRFGHTQSQSLRACLLRSTAPVRPRMVASAVPCPLTLGDGAAQPTYGSDPYMARMTLSAVVGARRSHGGRVLRRVRPTLFRPLRSRRAVTRFMRTGVSPAPYGRANGPSYSPSFATEYLVAPRGEGQA